MSQGDPMINTRVVATTPRGESINVIGMQIFYYDTSYSVVFLAYNSFFLFFPVMMSSLTNLYELREALPDP